MTLGLSFISSYRYKLCASVSFLSRLCFLGEIIFDRRSTSTKGDTSVNPKNKLTYEEAVEKAGTFDKFGFWQEVLKLQSWALGYSKKKKLVKLNFFCRIYKMTEKPLSKVQQNNIFWTIAMKIKRKSGWQMYLSTDSVCLSYLMSSLCLMTTPWIHPQQTQKHLRWFFNWELLCSLFVHCCSQVLVCSTGCCWLCAVGPMPAMPWRSSVCLFSCRRLDVICSWARQTRAYWWPALSLVNHNHAVFIGHNTQIWRHLL